MEDLGILAITYGKKYELERLIPFISENLAEKLVNTLVKIAKKLREKQSR